MPGMTSDHRVSIIIPTYNAEATIEYCLKSALDQTWKNKEIIVVDDGSSDATLNILAKYSAKIQIKRSKHEGAAISRNKGIEHSQGDYLQFLDADDTLDPAKIEKQIMALNGASTEVVAISPYSTFSSLTEGPYWKAQGWPFMSSKEPVQWLVDLWGGGKHSPEMIQTGCWLISKDLALKAGGWKKELSGSPDDDGEFFARVVCHSKEIVSVNDVYVHWRRYAQTGYSLSGRDDYRSAQLALETIREKEKTLFSFTDSKAARAAIANQYLIYVVRWIGKYPDLVEQARQSERRLGGATYYPGKTRFGFLSRVIGFKNAKTIALAWHKIKRQQRRGCA